MKIKLSILTILLLTIISITRASRKRNALPREIFRDDVEPKRGGKVPEAAKDPERIELNKQDAAGLKSEQENVQQNEIFDSSFDNGFFSSPFNDEDYGSDFPTFDPIKISGSSGGDFSVDNPQYTNPYAVMYDSLFKQPAKKPTKSKKKSSKDTYKYVDIDSGPPANNYKDYQEPYRPYIEPPSYDAPYQEPPSYDYSPGYDYTPPQNDYYSPPPQEEYYSPPPNDYTPFNDYSPPQNDYSPPSYEAPYKPPPSYEPELYLPPKPVGPVLLEKRPYEVKSVQPLPITVSESYTSFDCRSKHPGRHYADPEAGCQVYHFCHHDGKQDTFNCGYGTVFNEYIGTCDYKNNVHCTAGEGYIPKPHHNPHPEEHYHQHEYQYKHQTHQTPHHNSYQPQSDDFFSGAQDIQPFTNFGPF